MPPDVPEHVRAALLRITDRRANASAFRQDALSRAVSSPAAATSSDVREAVSAVEQAVHELATAAHADFVEHDLEVILHGVGGDAECRYDLRRRPSLKDEFGDAPLRRCEAVGSEEQC